MGITARIQGESRIEPFSLNRRFGSGEPVFSAWCRLGLPHLAELMAASHGFSAVTLDQQHGLYDFSSSVQAIGSIHAARLPSVVRIPVGDFGAASRMLDAGAEAIIAPMINAPEEAEALVAATKYPPLGKRSWGPHRALQVLQLNEAQYLRGANSLTLTFAMLETRAAIRNAAAILEIPGIDGAFVGPSDLSITLTDGEAQNPSHPEVEAALDIVAAIARTKGKIAGAHCPTADRAVDLARRGFQFLGVSSDASMFQLGLQATAKLLAGKQHV